MAVTAVVAHANNMMEECRDTVEFDCREKVCPESMVQLSSGTHTKGKRRNAQTLHHTCEHEIVDHDSETQTASCRTFGVPG